MAVTPLRDTIYEEYYQISEAFLDSFPKYRPPLDLFVLKENIAQLLLYSHKGQRLSNEQVEEVHWLCVEGNLFVARADHPIYSQHIVKQLDLVLADRNLKDSEIADISIQALTLRLCDFFAQPLKPQFEQLYNDVRAVTEYLWQDINRLKLFIRRLHRGDYSAALHAVNTLCVGLWLYAIPLSENTKRRDFDQTALAFLLHDVGMTKIPSFILAKTTPLKPDEKEKIPPHTLIGHTIMHKLDQSTNAMRQAILEHHERLDGSGYPRHTQDISPIGRITAVADAFSAMLQKRPYAEAKEPLAAARELADAKNKFDFAYSSKLLAALATGAFGKMQ